MAAAPVRRPRVPPKPIYNEQAFQELQHIVAGLQKDVKLVAKLSSKKAADKVIETKQVKKQWKGWSAVEADLTGPSGKPDGIPEVYVRDGENHVQYINGFTLRKTRQPQRKAYYDAYNEDAFRHKLDECGNPVFRNNPITHEPTTSVFKASPRRFENIKATFVLNNEGLLVAQTPMPDEVRGKVSLNKIFTNLIFDKIWNRVKQDIGLDNITNSPVQFYQFNKTRMWNLFLAQLKTSDRIPHYALGGKNGSGLKRFLKKDEGGLAQLVLELTQIWLSNPDVMNQLLQQASQPRNFDENVDRSHVPILNPQNLRDIYDLERRAVEIAIPDTFADQDLDF
jgi:hypothetical protein